MDRESDYNLHADVVDETGGETASWVRAVDAALRKAGLEGLPEFVLRQWEE